jgi:menaquinone-9 beta-reductase
VDYDLIVVGGGVAGAALSASVARSGARVLVIERSEQFHDRVRGDGIQPWGVAELRALGLDQAIGQSAQAIRYMKLHRASVLLRVADLTQASFEGLHAVGVFHPDLQEALLGEAQRSGAKVLRGMAITAVRRGDTQSVTGWKDDRELVLRGRLVVGADGRHSMVRNEAGFISQRDPLNMLISGTLLESTHMPGDTLQVFHSGRGSACQLVPIGARRMRVYFVTNRRTEHRPLSGPTDYAEFFSRCSAAGVPRSLLLHATPTGPLVTFEAADIWVDHPYQRGIALIGDAAASNDPSFSCGLSLALRDARVLSDALLSHEDWDVACRHYAQEHDRYYGALHTITRKLAKLLYGTDSQHTGLQVADADDLIDLQLDLAVCGPVHLGVSVGSHAL